jgi:hypothetical protein
VGNHVSLHQPRKPRTTATPPLLKHLQEGSVTDGMIDSNAPPVAVAHERIRLVSYDPLATIREARSLYFDANGFPADGGYAAKWVDFELGPIPMPFPNSDGRRRAVKVHDLHHVLTGYQTDIVGETEISAWELGAGCGDMIAAWLLNLGGMALGMLIAPHRTWRAWVRGRQTKSLYRESITDEFLTRRVGDLRTACNMSQPASRARPSDFFLFFLYWQIGAWGSLAVLPLSIASAVVAFGAGRVRKFASTHSGRS